MTGQEQPLLFACEGEELLGILSIPQQSNGVGVVIIVGGPQYRVGSHRQFVRLARALASLGFTVLRFDCRGMGDSSGPLLPFEEVSSDIAAAVQSLVQAAPTVHRVVLWGLCDAASAALLSRLHRRAPKVAGLVLVNPWVRSVAGLARTNIKHYYGQRLLQLDFWRKLLRGQIGTVAIRELASNALKALWRAEGRVGTTGSYQDRMAQAWERFDGPVLLLLSEHDLTAAEFLEYTSSNPRWQASLALRPPQRETIPGADHTCSQSAAQRHLEAATAAWLLKLVQSRHLPK